MVKDENVCLHCGLCAERCPTYAWDMRKFVLELPQAGTAFIPLEAVGTINRHGRASTTSLSRSRPPTAPGRPAPTA